MSRPGPFELHSVRTFPLTAELPLALASIAEATSQRRHGFDPLVGPDRTVDPEPPANFGTRRARRRTKLQTARAAFHYQPLRDDLGAEAALSVAQARRQRIGGLGVGCEARIAVCGWRGLHASGKLPHSNGGQVQDPCPTARGSPIRDGVIGQRRIGRAGSPAARLTRSTSNCLPAAPFAVLKLVYSTSRSLPRFVSSEQPPFPELDIPIMARQWSLWLPPGYEIADGDDRFAAGSIAAPTWTGRLFSLLGPSDGIAVFNPLSGAAWREAVDGDREFERGRAAADGFLRNLEAAVADSPMAKS